MANYTPPPSGGGSSSGVATRSQQSSSSSSLYSFFADVLRSMGITATDSAIEMLLIMAQGEGLGLSVFNPLATTQDMPGASSYNEVGVKEYSSWEEGVQATAFTLQNGFYPNLMAGLSQGAPLDWFLQNAQQDLMTWQGGSQEDINLLADATGNPNVGKALSAYAKGVGPGQGGPAGAGAGGAAQYKTPDGKTLTAGTDDYDWYNAVDSIWKGEYGSHVSWAIAAAVRSSGIKSSEQLQMWADSLPSPIQGIPLGEYRRVEAAAQKAANTVLGRPVPQSVIEQLFKEGWTDANDIHNWFEQHPASSIPKDDYKQLWDMELEWTKAVHNTQPTPSQVHHVWAQSQPKYTPPPYKPNDTESQYPTRPEPGPELQGEERRSGRGY